MVKFTINGQAAAVEADPAMPILFMSGYAEEQLRRDIDIPDMHFIAKPFSVASIGDKVGAVLREARAEAAAEA